MIIQFPPEFPPELQRILDAAVLHLWDEKNPASDLNPLKEWFEIDGWDDVIAGLVGPYVDIDSASEDFNDEVLMEEMEIVDQSTITNDNRVAFARGLITSKLLESMDSLSSIVVQTKKMPPAVLCIAHYYHGQGGVFFHDLCVCHSTEDYLRMRDYIIINDNQLSDSKIINLWRRYYNINHHSEFRNA